MKATILALFWLASQCALGQPGHKLEAYGDSLTAGFLADTNLTSPTALKDVSKALSDLAMFFFTGDFKYAQQHHRPDLAWPAKLAERLRADGSSVDLINRGVSGSSVAGLLDQLVDRNEDVGALFFSGHNDICENPKPADQVIREFEADYDSVLARWDQTHTGSRAYLMAVTRVDKVFVALQGVNWGKKSTYRCEDSWRKFFPYCPSYYKMLKEGTLVSFLQPRIDGMNAALEKLVDKYNRESKSNRFEYLGKVTDLDFVPNFFAFDCYHLSAAGQDRIAENIFRNTYF